MQNKRASEGLSWIVQLIIYSVILLLLGFAIWQLQSGYFSTKGLT